MRKLYFIFPIVILLVYSCEETISNFQSKNFIKFFGGGDESNGTSCIEIPSDGYIFTGYDIPNQSRRQIYAIKTDYNGNIIWENHYLSDSIQEGNIIKWMNDGSFIIVGGSKATELSVTNPFILKIDQYGNQIWKKNLIVSYSLSIHDITITADNIYFVGESYLNSTTLPDTYIAKFDLSGNLLGSDTKLAIREDLFKKIFVKPNNNLLVIGNSKSITGSSIKMVTFIEFQPNSLSNPINFYNMDSQSDQEIKDAIYFDNNIYLLIYENTQGVTKVIKLSSEFLKVWETESISQFKGKSITVNKNGELFVAGEYSNQIQFLRIDTQGVAYYGDDVYLKYPGSVSSLINTADNGLLMVGSTPAIYDNMVQLIKTGSDLYLLKP